MCKKQIMYLETLVISAYFDFWNDAPSQKKHTRLFWRYALNEYRIVVSDIVMSELKNFLQEKQRERFLKLVVRFPVLKLNDAVEHLAEEYINERIIPKSKKEDALHLAVCTAYGLDFLITWNQKHIVRPPKLNRF